MGTGRLPLHFNWDMCDSFAPSCSLDGLHFLVPLCKLKEVKPSSNLEQGLVATQTNDKSIYCKCVLEPLQPLKRGHKDTRDVIDIILSRIGADDCPCDSLVLLVQKL